MLPPSSRSASRLASAGCIAQALLYFQLLPASGMWSRRNGCATSCLLRCTAASHATPLHTPPRAVVLLLFSFGRSGLICIAYTHALRPFCSRCVPQGSFLCFFLLTDCQPAEDRPLVPGCACPPTIKDASLAGRLMARCVCINVRFSTALGREGAAAARCELLPARVSIAEGGMTDECKNDRDPRLTLQQAGSRRAAFCCSEASRRGADALIVTHKSHLCSRYGF